LAYRAVFCTGRQQSRILAAGLSCFLALVFCLSCTRKTQLKIFAFAVKEATEDFKDQKEDTSEALSEANEARQKAIQIRFKFTSDETERFIGRWKIAEREVQRLREDFNEVVKTGDFFFAYCEKKNRSIGESTIRLRISGAIDRKKRAFSESAIQANSAIARLEEAIAQGNDFISGLEIAGALNALDEQQEALKIIRGQSLEKIPEIDGLIKQGESLLETELGALGV
jgi:hypothetical protein